MFVFLFVDLSAFLVMKCPLSLITFPGLNSARHPTSHCMHAHTCAHMHTRIQTNSIHVQTPTHTHKFRLSLFFTLILTQPLNHTNQSIQNSCDSTRHTRFENMSQLCRLSLIGIEMFSTVINDDCLSLLSSLLQVSLFLIDVFSSTMASLYCCPHCFKFHSFSLINSHQ